MKKEISHNTTSLTLLGVLEQQQLKVGEGNSGPVSILFDNGSTNKPGIRYVSPSSGSATEYTITDGSTVYVLTQAITPVTWPMGTMDAGEDVTLTPALTGAGRIWLTADNQYVMMSSLTDASGVATGDVANWILASFETPKEASSIMFSDTVANPEDGTWTNSTTSETYDPSPVEVTGRSNIGIQVSGAGTTEVNGFYAVNTDGTSWTNITDSRFTITNQHTRWAIVNTETAIACYITPPVTTSITGPTVPTWIVNGSNGTAPAPTLKTVLKPVGSGWEYSNDGITWTPMTSGSGSVNLTGEPINITPADLADGKATISHNLGCKYPLGIGYDKVPQNITFQDDNTMIVDYGDQPSDFTAVLWFYGSTQAMLVPPPLTEYITPINMTSNTSDADWEVYVESPNAKIEEGSVNAWKACAGSETTATMYQALTMSDVVTGASAQVDFIFHRKDDQAWTPINLVQGTKLNYPISTAGVRTITLRGSDDGTNWVTITDVNGNETNDGTVGGGGRDYREVSLDYSNNTAKYKYWDVCMNKDITYPGSAYGISIVAVNKLQFTYLM